MPNNSDASGDELDRQLGALTDLVTPWAIRAFISLGIPHRLVAGEQELFTLATDTQCNVDALRILLDYLLEHSVVSCQVTDAGVSYRLMPLGQRLVEDEPGKMPWSRRLDVRGSLTRIDQAHAGLVASLESGRAGYANVFGKPFWEDLADNSELSESFDNQLAGWARRWVPAIASHGFWSQFNSLVDVAGGTGTLTSELLRRNPALHSTLVELPASADRARSVLAGWIEADRCKVLVGDIFSELPEHAEAYVLAQILHDWDDEQAVSILRSCVEAGGPSSEVVLVERVVADVPSDGISSAERAGHAEMNLMMLVLFGAKERSLAQYQDLASKAGLSFVDATPTEFGLWSLRFR